MCACVRVCVLETRVSRSMCLLQSHGRVAPFAFLMSVINNLVRPCVCMCVRAYKQGYHCVYLHVSALCMHVRPPLNVTWFSCYRPVCTGSMICPLSADMNATTLQPSMRRAVVISRRSIRAPEGDCSGRPAVGFSQCHDVREAEIRTLRWTGSWVEQ